MTYERPYGQREGLENRLEEAAERMARDKGTPWLGFGLYDDLRAAAAVLRGKPVPPLYSAKPPVEYDL